MTVGKALMLIGLAVFALGFVLTFMPGMFGWFGKLPGDVRIEKENSFIFIPITSMIIVSLVLTLILNLLFRR